MASSSVLSKIPLLRILLPFMLGIMVQRLCPDWYIAAALMAIGVSLYAFLVIKSKSPVLRMSYRPLFIIPIAMSAMSLGWIAAIIHQPPQLSNTQRVSRILSGRVVDLQFTDFSSRLTVDVMNADMPPCRVMISTRGCDYTQRAGNLISWPGMLIEVGNTGNPDEMDYAAYLFNSQHIRYHQHLPSSQVVTTGYSPTLETRMANLRRDLSLMIFNTRLSPQAQHFIAALFLGNSGLIDKATRQEFSTAGVAHVLALSGLHVGIIAFIIWWLMFPLDYLGLKKLRLFITLVGIVAFAVFTGMSPSVMRATAMFGCVFVSTLFYRRTVTLNALALAALIILIFSPASLFSVGFQLSFITVAAILSLARVPRSLMSRHRWINGITTTTITSLVAMLATIALSAHYFHTVSLMSVIANLLILPVLPVFMVLGALFLLVSAAGMQWPVLNSLIEFILRYINWATGFVNAIPFSHISGFYVSTTGVVLYFIMMALVVAWIYRHGFKYLLGAGIMLVILLGHSLWIDATTPRQGLVVFNSYSATPVLYYERGNAYVWTPDQEDIDSTAFAQYYAGFLARHEIERLEFITNEDTLRLEGGMMMPPFAHLMGRRLMAVGSGKWKHMAANERLSLNHVIVTKRYHGTVGKLQQLFRFDSLIISGAHHESQPLINDCDSLHIGVHDLGTQGAYCLP